MDQKIVNYPYPLHCVCQGEGPDLVLLHGFGEDHRIWEYQVNSLSKTYRVWTPDLPGSGHSPLPDAKLSMECLASIIAEYLQQQGVHRYLLGGHSMGGYVALAMAEKEAEKVQGLMLIHSTAHPDDEPKKEKRLKSMNLVREGGKHQLLKAMIPELWGPKHREGLPDLLDYHLSMALQMTEVAFIAYYQAMIERPSRIRVFEDNNRPVLFVIGSEDSAIPMQSVLQQCKYPRRSMVKILRETGHTGMLECPDTMNKMIDRFCQYCLMYELA